MAHSFSEDVALIGRIEAVPNLLKVLCDSIGLRFAAVARVTDTQWTACAVEDRLGTGPQVSGQLPLHTTLCDEVRDTHRTIIIDHASTDPLYCDHHTPRLYAFESYIAVPLFFPDGRLFGTLCAFDPLPRPLKDGPAVAVAESFARLLSSLMEAQDRQQHTEQALLMEQDAAELREQFIAVLGHDLRNPLFAMSAGAELLLRRGQDERTTAVLRNILTAGERASKLVADVLDFARGRLGGGINVNLAPCLDLSSTLRHVVGELQSIHPERHVALTMGDIDGVTCDPQRIAQLVSNLASNALTHGDKAGTVTVSAQRGEAGLTISVHNPGPVIEGLTLLKLFQPFRRGRTHSSGGSGLGLGLYIAQQIAVAHGGRLEVTSTAQDGTLFSFYLPEPVTPPYDA